MTDKYKYCNHKSETKNQSHCKQQKRKKNITVFILEDALSIRTNLIMHLMPVFILEMYSQTNNKCLPKFVQLDNAPSSIKMTIEGLDA